MNYNKTCKAYDQKVISGAEASIKTLQSPQGFRVQSCFIMNSREELWETGNKSGVIYRRYNPGFGTYFKETDEHADLSWRETIKSVDVQGTIRKLRRAR